MPGLLAVLTCGHLSLSVLAQPAAPLKRAPAFHPPDLVARARDNAGQYEWAGRIRDGIVAAAQPWLGYSDDELWDMMFGPAITRSWMVWSNGFCPACKEPVPMYNWRMDPHGEPWKVRCPHCNQAFPTNDFAALYGSGLDEHGVFDPARADRSLLFNAEHPDPGDPLRLFGVDDGEGYVDGGNRWRFIGAYLIYGQWKRLILEGIKSCAAAYVVTGDETYAHRAGVLLDRVANLYPTFDFKTQALVYEKPGAAGYVSTWHDACEEVRELALAYDQVFEGIRGDAALVDFLSRKAAEHGLGDPKSSFADIQRNIESGILRDTVANAWKINSNYPRTDIALAVIKAVLEWPDNKDEVCAIIDPMLETATAVDGVTGEKGLSGYCAYATQGTAMCLGWFSRLDPGFLAEMLERHPRLADMFRFHVDTWCLGRYYPHTGDCGAFGTATPQYVGVGFTRSPGVEPSMYSLLWDLHKLTGDPAFAQLLYLSDGSSVDGLPSDLLAEDPAAVQQGVAAAVEAHGAAPVVGSVNKQAWHLAILRSGEGADARAAWLDYDAGERHGHLDGMNLGLFAYGLDLMPDFGYPPVQYGGWEGERFSWYVTTASHNTVVVDGRQQASGAGACTLWADGETFRAVRASAPSLYGIPQYERTVATVDTPTGGCYLIDVFRVVGGSDHAKFMGSHFGTIATTGLALSAGEDYGHGAILRNTLTDPAPTPGWSVDWTIEDRLKLLDGLCDVHLRCTDLTTGASASTSEAWISTEGYTSDRDAWVPRLMVQRQGAEPLTSTFVSVIEPYRGSSGISQVRRLRLVTPDGTPFTDACVAVEVTLADGTQDLFIAADTENPLGLTPSLASAGALLQPEWGVRADTGFFWLRRGP